MKIEKVLEELEVLFKHWKIPTNAWIFASQYAERLQGYDVEVRKGHLNILINQDSLPWRVGKELETHPPSNTEYAHRYQNFMDKTGFEFDLIPVSKKDFNNKIKKTTKYELYSGKKILLQTPWGGLDELDNIFSRSNKGGWGEEKGYRVFPHLDDVKKAALKRGEIDLAKAYERLQKEYEQFGIKSKQKVIGELEETKSVVKGISVSIGKVKGIVNIVLNPEATTRFENGEILVTIMTSPKFTPFFNKVAAIVTDEGGILCHAAIVSRELGVPCIVGTKIATKVLKDGDLVEVDAVKGIVRKLKK